MENVPLEVANDSLPHWKIQCTRQSVWWFNISEWLSLYFHIQTFLGFCDHSMKYCAKTMSFKVKWTSIWLTIISKCLEDAQYVPEIKLALRANGKQSRQEAGPHCASYLTHLHHFPDILPWEKLIDYLSVSFLTYKGEFYYLLHGKY